MYGEMIKKRRLDFGLSLRAFCLKFGEDPSNWSKLERGLLKPPAEPQRLQEIADRLEYPKGSRERQAFLDLADAERGRIPQDIMSEEDLVSNLPIVFRTLRGDAPTEEELRRLASLKRLHENASQRNYL
jgi:transcriptional regulator with XRE-family HTH domain